VSCLVRGSNVRRQTGQHLSRHHADVFIRWHFHSLIYLPFIRQRCANWPRHQGRIFHKTTNRSSTEPAVIQAIGYAAKPSSCRLEPFDFVRNDAGSNEIQIDVLYCGVCHSDIYQVKKEWFNTVYPFVPGHEVVGRVVKIGPGVTRHAVGDWVGVGCTIDSCRHCEPCLGGDQNYCAGPNGCIQPDVLALLLKTKAMPAASTAA